MKIYLIPGLGADRRMYEWQLKLFPEAEVIEHLPVIKGETITDYAKRIGTRIETFSPFILIGTSLGGIISMELSRFLQPEKIILLSSVKNRTELPLFIRSMKYLKLHRLVSGKAYKRFNTLMVKRLYNRKNSEAAEIIKAMTTDAPAGFIEWAIDAVIKWNPPVEYRNDIVHIHGTKDQLFPFTKIKNAIAINNGSHVMNMTMSHEVNAALLKAIG